MRELFIVIKIWVESYSLTMIATLQLQLADALSPSELRDLADLAVTQNKPIERVLYEAAKREVARIRQERAGFAPVPDAAETVNA